MKKCLYQTVENRENADEVERDAPYLCANKEAWLGSGYYFWDTFIELAHQWGKFGYNDNYFVCKVIGEFQEEELLDLVGNTEQICDIREITRKLEETYKNKLTTPWVIEYLKKHTSFGYSIIRANFEHSFSNLRDYRLRVSADKNKIQYLNLCPAIQCCVLNKEILKLPVEIVYPQNYSLGYI